jgi:hypothetical protein
VKINICRSVVFKIEPSTLTDTGVLVEVAGLVATDETGGLDLGSRATGETGVEVHNTLHAGSILGSTDGLEGRYMLAIVRVCVGGI